MGTIKMPKTALHFMDHKGFAQLKDKDGQDSFHMVAYSGGVIKNHWYWGNLVIDLAGMSFPKSKYPILESHETRKKIAFVKKPDLSSGAIEFDSAEFVDTEESKEFRKLAKSGFPYEASIYAVPSSVERVSGGEKTEVNGMTFKGPGSIWRKSTFREASVCVFGADSNTKSTAFVDDEVDVDLETVNHMSEEDDMPSKKPEQKSSEKEVMIMNEQELRDKYPELVAQVETSISEKMEANFDEKEAELQAENSSLEKRVLKMEKAEAIRQEKDIADDADKIWEKALAKSDIPERLHTKVRVQVGYDKFVKDDMLDTAAFKQAVSDEVEDWEKRGATSQVMGTGFTSRDVEVSETTQANAQKEVDDKLADEIFTAAGGHRKEVS